MPHKVLFYRFYVFSTYYLFMLYVFSILHQKVWSMNTATTITMAVPRWNGIYKLKTTQYLQINIQVILRKWIDFYTPHIWHYSKWNVLLLSNCDDQMSQMMPKKVVDFVEDDNGIWPATIQAVMKLIFQYGCRVLRMIWFHIPLVWGWSMTPWWCRR